MSTTHRTQLSAILAMIATMGSLSTKDTLSKKLMLSVAPVTIIWTHFALRTALVSATIWPKRVPALWRTRQWRLQLLCGALGFALMSAAVPFFWPDQMSWPDLALLGLVALADSYGQYFTVLAFSKAPASVLSPCLYEDLVLSALDGWWMFDHLPDPLALCGMGMIAVFGLAAGWLNQRKTNP